MSRADSTYYKSGLEIISFFDVGFKSGFHKESNDAERAMIASLIQAILSHAKKSEWVVDDILNRVFINSNAKYVHFLMARNFKDYVRSFLPSPIFVDKFDNATFRIGIGWLGKNECNLSQISGVQECTDYLRGLVNSIWLEIRCLLSKLNKNKTVMKLLKNHEALDSDIQWWKVTYKSALGLHEDKDHVRRVVSEQVSLRNESTLGSRLVLEMAICECDSENGYSPSNIDLTKLISYVSFMFQVGGASDAIRYEMIPAEIRISSTGDVLFDQSFFNDVVKPYGISSHKVMLDKNEGVYSEYFNDPAVVANAADFFESDFNKAWLSEYKFGIDDARKIIDFLENKGIEIQSAVFEIETQELVASCEDLGLSKNVIDGFLDSMILSERPSWDSPSKDFKMNDILPWRFRRRLSAISRPLIKIDTKLIVAPGLIRSGFLYLVRNCHQASFETSQIRSQQMKQWIGQRRNYAGHQFNKKVANALRENGWCAESDVLLTKLLNKKLDKNYGDIDVFAWNPETGKVLLVECKDLEFAKTPSEIARQIYEFRGVIRDNGRPDRLLKHLERVRVIKENKDLLVKTMKLKPGERVSVHADL